jgi:hypothetical protein
VRASVVDGDNRLASGRGAGKRNASDACVRKTLRSAPLAGLQIKRDGFAAVRHDDVHRVLVETDESRILRPVANVFLTGEAHE